MDTNYKYLEFKDAKTGETVCQVMLEFHENENYWSVLDTESPIFKTYEFMIECAVYCINEGQMHFDVYTDDEDKPLAFWALTDKVLFTPVLKNNERK
jgi:hemolysin-activating ACP:hemolysin acyltransferase